MKYLLLLGGNDSLLVYRSGAAYFRDSNTVVIGQIQSIRGL